MNPVQVLVATWQNSGGGAAQSQSWTGTFVMTAGFFARVPVIIINQTVACSAAQTVTVYRSADFGATWETVGSVAATFPLPVPASATSRIIEFEPGYYLISVCVGGGVASTWTVQIGTAWVITSYV